KEEIVGVYINKQYAENVMVREQKHDLASLSCPFNHFIPVEGHNLNRIFKGIQKEVYGEWYCNYLSKVKLNEEVTKEKEPEIEGIVVEILSPSAKTLTGNSENVQSISNSVETTDSRVSFSQLNQVKEVFANPALLAHIFFFLPASTLVKVSGVCKEWRNHINLPP